MIGASIMDVTAAHGSGGLPLAGFPDMRWWLLSVLAACGGDRSTPVDEPPADASVESDGGALAGDDASLGDADAPEPEPATLCEQATSHSDLAWLETNVFVPRCALCHGGDEPSANLRLEAGTVRANLVGVTSSTVGTPWVRVAPGSIADSYLMVALGQTPGPPPSLGFMPLGEPALCAEIHDAIGRWITAGAD